MKINRILQIVLINGLCVKLDFVPFKFMNRNHFDNKHNVVKNTQTDTRDRFFIPTSLKTRFDVYETLCPQQMLVHKGGQIKNWRGECRDKIAVSNYSKSTSKSKSAKGGYSKKIK